jgi:hypothetical protein
VGALGPAYARTPVSLAFQGKGNRSCSREECGALSSCVSQEVGFTVMCQIMNRRAVQRLQGWQIGSVELLVVLPILLV